MYTMFIQYLCYFQAEDKYGITPLLSAIYEGHEKCVALLLEKVRWSIIIHLFIS